MSVHVLGIRHHGPGSARSLCAALDELAPDCVLVEGPPDGDGLVRFVTAPGMAPPVALLVHQPGAPARAVYYPFAEFSPEWQALLFAARRGVPARFMDLPMAHRFALRLPRPQREVDPIATLGRAAGYDDPELWWEHAVEERRDSRGVFGAILEAMTAVRGGVHSDDEEDLVREAWMRRAIRAAERAGHARIAVVCGAWHAPALAARGPARPDDARLRGLPRVKVAATWVPWTHGRLTLDSGYGAGVRSPGFYAHLWHGGGTSEWMVRVARLLRGEDLDASSGHVIDAVRLAEATAALRGRPAPGLAELTEATQAVICGGSDLPLRIVRERLIVGEALGAVPEDAPTVPLARDLEAQRRSLRLRAEAEERLLELDLRRAIDRERSQLLHRLQILGIPWGQPEGLEGVAVMGTFRERWRLRWDPEIAVDVIEAGMWGNTVADAATACAVDAAERASDLARLGDLLDVTLLAALPDAVAGAMARLDDVAAVTADVLALMRALPALARVVRYGDVRRTDAGTVAHVVDGMVARVCVGLPAACASLDDAAATRVLAEIDAVHGALAALAKPEHRGPWLEALGAVAAAETIHGLVGGRALRLLLDAGVLDPPETVRRVGLALARARAAGAAAAWAEGFLRGSGLLLVHDDALWQVIDGWLASLDERAFADALPLLRRTFAAYEAAERRAIGERARRAAGGAAARAAAEAPFDDERGRAALALAARLLGVEDG